MTACAVALVLLLDASGSINAGDWQHQLHGTAEAMADPATTRLIEAGGPVAVTALAFDFGARELVPWRILSTAHDARRFARALRDADRGGAGGTDIGLALLRGMEALEAAPCVAEREVIDLATDGEGEARSTAAARDQAVAAGVTVNAIVVGGEPAADWLRAHAQTPGGFTLRAPRWDDFTAAMRRKLTWEISGR